MGRIKVLAICAMAVLSFSSANAQFETGADIVSSYVWRGFTQTEDKGAPNIQPFVSFTIGRLTLGSWASTSFLGNVKEIDLYATYAFSSQFALTVTDYNCEFASSKGYFDYTKSGDHVFEATLAYTGTEKFPISASVNTMFAGKDKSITDSTKQAFTTYIELGYQLPRKWMESLKMNSARVFINGLNVYTFKNKLDDYYVDPEIPDGYGAMYPIQKIWSFGLDINF